MDTRIRDDRPDVDRVLLAAQLATCGEHSAAQLILHTLVHVGPQVEADFGRLCVLLTELDDLTMQVQLCRDDPRHYVDLYEDDRPNGTLLAYSEERCAELDADIAQVLADARVHASAIADRADRWAAAS